MRRNSIKGTVTAGDYHNRNQCCLTDAFAIAFTRAVSQSPMCYELVQHRWEHHERN